jgi:Asp-tRNA(Asn)/Glu-tRNA(Gln) amidotransferase B subunit
MSIPKKDAAKMLRLAKEGKQISRIVAENFKKEYDYWDVYSVVYGAGDQSAQGVKWMITNRLGQLAKANKADRESLVEELSELIMYVYENYKSNQKKLDNIRKILDK